MRIGLVGFLFFWGFLSLALSAQDAQSEAAIFLKKTEATITVDGVLQEVAWFNGTPAVDFWETFPNDSSLAPVQTEVYMTFDDKHLYVAAKCYSVGKDYVTPSLRRDYNAGGSDNITFLFDPFNDRTNAFVFGMNPHGVTREALVANGGRSNADWNGSWDNKWQGVSKIYDGYWTCELAIPFSTLRFREGSQEWNFNCYRFDTQSGTRSTWQHIPRNQTIMSLAYMGKMYWEEPLEKPGANVSLIPFVTGGHSEIFTPEEDQDTDSFFDLGGDAKIVVTPGLNLDLTVNPDFSQVEVDEQVTNLDRFEIFFPERRQFFLENSDLFGDFGDNRINPFFSRRIGVAQDTATGSNIQNPILFGARLSGKLNDDWRLGLLNMQTAKDDKNALPSFNYTVAALQRKVFSRSNVGLIFVNKQTFADVEDNDELDPHNRVIGIDYNLANSDNSWTGKIFLHASLNADKSANKSPVAHGARLTHTKRRYSISWEQQFVGENYNAEVGFVPRTNFYSIAPEVRLFYYPEKGRIIQHGPGVEANVLWTPGFGRTDHRYELYWDADFRATNSFRAQLVNTYTYLLDPFDPTRVNDDVSLDTLTGYNYTNFEAFYRSDRRKKVSYSLEPTIGQFYNGFRVGMEASLTWRYQPLGAIAMTVNYNHIDLPEPFRPANLYLIGPRIDLTFSKSVFLTTFVQYNSQLDNINVNARFQWRFAPVSDFFLVYTDNYIASNIQVRSRAIVAKVTYWLNV